MVGYLLFLLCVAAAISCERTRLFETRTLSARTEDLRTRLLQATGYSPGTDADEQKFCGDMGINFQQDLVVSEADLAGMSGSFNTKFTSVGLELLDLIKGGGFNGGFPAKASGIVTKLPMIVLSIIGVALIALFLIVALVYGLVKCLCGAAKKKDDEKENKEEKKEQYQDNNKRAEEHNSHQRQGQNQQDGQSPFQEDKERRPKPETERDINTQRQEQHPQDHGEQRKQGQQSQEQQSSQDKQKSDSSDRNQSEQKSDKKQEIEDTVKVQNRWKYASYVLGGSAFVLTVVWFVYLGIAVSRVKFVVCGVAGFKKIAVQGDLSGSVKFAGVNGLTFLAQKALDSVSNFPATSVSAQLSSINSKNFVTESAQVLTDFNSINYGESRYQYTGLDGSAKVTPPSVREYVAKIYPVDLKLEASAFTSLASGLGSAATVFAKTPAVTTDSLNLFTTSLNLALKTPAEKFLQMVSGGSPDYMAGIKRLGYVVLILGGILIFVALIILGIVLYYVAKLLAALTDNKSDDEEENKKKNKDSNEQQKDQQKSEKHERSNQPGENHQNDHEADRLQRQQNHGHQHHGQQSDQERNRQQQENRNSQSEQQQREQAEEKRKSDDKKRQEEEQKKSQSNTDDSNNSNKGCLQKLLSLSGVKIVQLVVSLVLIVLSLAIFIYAIAAVFGSVAFSTVCTMSNKILTEGQFVAELSASGYFTPEASGILKECISARGNGNIKNILGSSLPTDLIAMIDGGGSVAAYSSFKSKYTDSTPPVSTGFSTKLADYVTLKTKDSDSNSNDIEAGRTAINSNKCSSDTAGYNDGVCASSSTSDSDNTGLGTNFCFNFNNFQAAGYPTRYQSGVTCTGGASSTTGQSSLTNTLKAVAAYKTAMTQLQTDFNLYYQGSGGAKGVKQLYADLKASDADVTAISAHVGVKALVDSQAGFNGGLESSGNCTLLRKGLIATQVAVCEKVFKPFYTQMALSFVNACALLGAGIALLGSCYYTSKVELLTS